jgi:hypothetical protein
LPVPGGAEEHDVGALGDEVERAEVSAVGAFERDFDEMDRRRQHFVVVLLGVRGVLERNTVEEGEEHAGERVRADRGIDASFAEIPREERREHGLIDAVSL